MRFSISAASESRRNAMPGEEGRRGPEKEVNDEGGGGGGRPIRVR